MELGFEQYSSPVCIKIVGLMLVQSFKNMLSLKDGDWNKERKLIEKTAYNMAKNEQLFVCLHCLQLSTILFSIVKLIQAYWYCSILLTTMNNVGYML